MEKFNKLKELVMEIEGDADKFYNKGNNAAGTRVRKGLQDLKSLSQELRQEIQNKKNTSSK